MATLDKLALETSVRPGTHRALETDPGWHPVVFSEIVYDLESLS